MSIYYLQVINCAVLIKIIKIGLFRLFQNYKKLIIATDSAHNSNHP